MDDNKVNLSKGTEVTPPANTEVSRGFEGNGAFYSELPPAEQKKDFRINAAIQPNTFNAIVIGAVVGVPIALITAILVILKILF